VASVIADLDTRCGELYPSGDEVLPAAEADSEDAAAAGGGDRGSPAEAAGGGAFAVSRERFELLIGFLDGTDAAGLSHAELEEHLDVHGRELLRCLLDDHLARSVRVLKIGAAGAYGPHHIVRSASNESGPDV
jgi:hypothetical protein